MTDKPVSSLELAEEMIALDAETLTAADTAQLQRLILDYGAVTLCGSTQPWGRKMRTWSQKQRAIIQNKALKLGRVGGGQCLGIEGDHLLGELKA